jgi:hypothetical protein
MFSWLQLLLDIVSEGSSSVDPEPERATMKATIMPGWWLPPL